MGLAFRGNARALLGPENIRATPQRVSILLGYLNWILATRDPTLLYLRLIGTPGYRREPKAATCYLLLIDVTSSGSFGRLFFSIDYIYIISCY